MGLSEKEIGDIAKQVADRIITQFHEPTSVRDGLVQSMLEEATASNFYRRRAESASKSGDPETVKLYFHIADEEDVHYNEFSKRLDKITQ